ncbi:PHDfinger domain containing protein [Acanthamoeba castellanii str. Neff]|uniref:PHDfinger domain containing protein n=1 Tax=Acanthamoeba castellanii (strain ATCC 30010 / Neff) TaxID=1257118 RepID=L8HD78_ACACF|nr:PHDfinger domain containing protein [Acanthamoeba castellanii str. Neff]ELR23115.1 PHDfinger domain containing protein [Acanthamoeba castellanii str. Neff]
MWYTVGCHAGIIEGGEKIAFPIVFPIAFSMHMSGQKFCLTCLWHSKRIKVCPLIELMILNQIDLKQCFLIRHKIIKIVQAVGGMLDNICNKLIYLPPPHSDLWWQWHCCEKVTEGKYILCNRCGQWFHWECIKIVKKPSGSWYCPTCLSKLKPKEALGAMESGLW